MEDFFGKTNIVRKSKISSTNFDGKNSQKMLSKSNKETMSCEISPSIVPSSSHLAVKAFQENILGNLDLKCLDEFEETAKKAKKKRPSVICPDCKAEVRSNNIKCHRESHVKKLGEKKNRCGFEGCSFSTGRKSVLTKHALVHDKAHQIQKLLRRKEKKIQTKQVGTEGNPSSRTPRTDTLKTGTTTQSTKTDPDGSNVAPRADTIQRETATTQSTQTDPDGSSVAPRADTILETAITQSTQTDPDGSNVAISIVSAKVQLFKDILNMHYGLMGDVEEESSGQRETFAKIFEAMVEPLKSIFHSIKSLIEDHSTDRNELMRVHRDFKQMVSEMTTKCNMLTRDDEVEIVAGGIITYVADTNTYISHYELMKELMNEAKLGICSVAVPQKVCSELDGLTKNHNCAFNARESLRLLNSFASFLIMEPFLDYMNDELLYAKTNIPRREGADNSIVSYASKLMKNKKYTVVMLTEDKAVLTKFGSKAKTPQAYKLFKISSGHIKRENVNN